MSKKSASESAYEIIQDKIFEMRGNFSNLEKKSDDFIFSALCVRANYFKNPALTFDNQQIEEIIVDGKGDGGVDAILVDPNSDYSDLVLVQSKFYEEISFDDIRDAFQKMFLFYKEMNRGNYNQYNDKVTKRFLNLEEGDESCVNFVFYTSASKNRISVKRIERLLEDNFSDASRFSISVYFGNEIIEEIKEFDGRRSTVEFGKVNIDFANNILRYQDASVVNVSAFSVKELFYKHGNNLLSKNLRYYIRNNKIDSSIRESIRYDRENFWFKNNGITIICEDYNIDGLEVHLYDFSIINGGQTVNLISKHDEVNREKNFYLPCKIIKVQGDDENEKSDFILKIAKAVNSQKPIKELDLKANAHEQVLFGQALRQEGVFYKTKRGENIPKEFKVDTKNTDLMAVGKLCLAGIFQRPATSRNKPSILFNDQFYSYIFEKEPKQKARYVSQLLYIDYYFRNTFIDKFEKETNDLSGDILPFARNARTICIAFSALVARYINGNITDEDLKCVFRSYNKSNAYDDYLFDIFKNIGDSKYLFPKHIELNKDVFDNILYRMFNSIIKVGSQIYMIKKQSDASITATNYLKNDTNYYGIICTGWSTFNGEIEEIRKVFVNVTE